MAIAWKKDVDAALEQARREQKPLLLDFNAAPMWGACARLDAEVYPDTRVENFIREHYLPVKIHVKEQPQMFERFGAQWTPTMQVLAPDGTKAHDWQGFLPADDFLAQLQLGIAHLAFKRGDWPQAERLFRRVVDELPQSDAAPEALYWAGVARYKGTNDASALGETAQAFRKRYSESTWAKKASVWAA